MLAKSVKCLRRGEEGGALGLLLGREFFPLRAADGTEENGVGLGADFQRGVREGLAVVIDAGAADVGFRVGEGEVFLPGDVFEHAQGLGHDFGANVVSGKDGELECGHRNRNGYRGGRERGRGIFAVAAPRKGRLLAA